MSRRNALSKQLSETSEILNNAKVIAYDELETIGNAPVMDLGITTCTFDGETIEVILDERVSANESLANNRFIVAIVNETKKTISLTTENGKVSQGTLTLNIPSDWANTDQIHAIPLITNETSALTSFGSFIIKVRPEKKSN
jgi:hypothetical protein